MRDIIGLDVLRVNGKVDDALAHLERHVELHSEVLEIEGETYVIRASIAELNNVNALLPEDMDAKQAIPIQLKIADMLQKAGLNVGINDEMANALEEEEEAETEPEEIEPEEEEAETEPEEIEHEEEEAETEPEEIEHEEEEEEAETEPEEIEHEEEEEIEPEPEEIEHEEAETEPEEIITRTVNNCEN